MKKQGVGDISAEDCYFYWDMRGDLLTCPDIRGHLYDGQLRGAGQISDMGTKTNLAFSAHGQLAGGRLPIENSDKRGKLDAHGKISGRLVPGWREKMEGKLEVKVREGELFRIPVFGGLSKVLSKIWRGIGFASQSDFSASFTIGDGKMSTKKAELKGNVLSAVGRGSIYFDRRLDLNIEAKLLKDGALAKTVQVLTMPITKLLEIKLMGTIDKPAWRPKNLPKELFFQFD